jgi:hypothetical protein
MVVACQANTQIGINGTVTVDGAVAARDQANAGGERVGQQVEYSRAVVGRRRGAGWYW